jgi:F5/8 type C domain
VFAITVKLLMGKVMTTPEIVLLSQGKPAGASSRESYLYIAGNAVDGSQRTRWASVLPNKGDEWIFVDLQQICIITTVKLYWEAAYAIKYRIEASNSGVMWTPIHNHWGGDGGIDSVTWTSKPTARYIRVYCTVRGTVWGYSLRSLEVFGYPTK